MKNFPCLLLSEHNLSPCDRLQGHCCEYQLSYYCTNLLLSLVLIKDSSMYFEGLFWYVCFWSFFSFSLPGYLSVITPYCVHVFALVEYCGLKKQVTILTRIGLTVRTIAGRLVIIIKCMNFTVEIASLTYSLSCNKLRTNIYPLRINVKAKIVFRIKTFLSFNNDLHYFSNNE